MYLDAPAYKTARALYEALMSTSKLAQAGVGRSLMGGCCYTIHPASVSKSPPRAASSSCVSPPHMQTSGAALRRPRGPTAYGPCPGVPSDRSIVPGVPGCLASETCSSRQERAQPPVGEHRVIGKRTRVLWSRTLSTSNTRTNTRTQPRDSYWAKKTRTAAVFAKQAL